MRGKIQMAILCGVAMVCLCQPAFADDLGELIAVHVCHKGELYELSKDYAAVWNQAHKGTFSVGAGEVKTVAVYVFEKQSGSDSGVCTVDKTFMLERSMYRANVTRTGNKVTAGQYELLR